MRPARRSPAYSRADTQERRITFRCGGRPGPENEAVSEKPRLLFLCTGNSVRSQMAEGWARVLLGHLYEAQSAGIEPKGLDPRAAEVMREAGVDISAQRSKHLREVKHLDFDYAITLCDSAARACPVFPAKTRVLHRDFDDPAQVSGSEDEVRSEFRRARDEIRDFVLSLPKLLEGRAGEGGPRDGREERT